MGFHPAMCCTAEQESNNRIKLMKVSGYDESLFADTDGSDKA